MFYLPLQVLPALIMLNSEAAVLLQARRPLKETVNQL